MRSTESSGRQRTCCRCEKDFELEENALLSRRLSIDLLCPACFEIDKKEQHEQLKNNYVLRLYDFPYKYINIIKTLAKPAKSVFLYGSCGVGKTVEACAIAKSYAYELRKVYFVSCPRLVIKLQSIFKQSDESIEDVVMKVAEKDVLLLDDLGAEKITEFVRQCLYMIINYREQNEMETIITSNFNLKEIANQIDVRISSRIAGICEVVNMQGKDQRINP